MLRKLTPALLALFGLAAGTGAGLVLRPSAPPATAVKEGASQSRDPAQGENPAKTVASPAESGHSGDTADAHSTSVEKGDAPAHDYVKLNNQFVVPVVQNGRVAALVILSLSLEVATGSTEKVFQVEPKLRDGFLQVMFDHANTGGFMGTFTDGSNMILLREALREVAQRVLGPDVTDVLIVDIVRQDS